MNAALQCLSNCEVLAKYFLVDMHIKEINKKNPLGQQGELAVAFADLIQTLYKKNLKSTGVDKIRKKIAMASSTYKGNSQQDLMELLLFLLDSLHEDLNRVKDKPHVIRPDYGGRPDEIVSKEQWDYYIKSNASIIVDLFSGQLKSTIFCPFCKFFSINFEPFMSLTVQIPVKMKSTVLFIPYDFQKEQKKIEIEIKKSMVFSDLLSEVKTILCLLPSAKIQFCGIQKGKVEKYFELSEQVLEAEDVNIYAFEFEDILQQRCHLIEIRPYIENIGRGDYRPLEHPFLHYIPISKNLAELKLSIFHRFSHYLSDQKTAKEIIYKKEFLNIKGDPPYLLGLTENHPKTPKPQNPKTPKNLLSKNGPPLPYRRRTSNVKSARYAEDS